MLRGRKAPVCGIVTLESPPLATTEGWRDRWPAIRSIHSVVSSVRATRLAIVLTLAAVLGCTSTPTGPIGGEVSVVGSWSGAEEQAFLAMVRPFEQQTGIVVDYKGTRNLTATLWEGVAK